MISCPTIKKKSIRFHYDLATPLYRLFWGRHIHHGLWSGDESPRQAQQQLTDALARAAVRYGDRVLDVGCGMGGSAIYLAREYGCRVRGVTVSRVQQGWATAAAWWQRAGRDAHFCCADVEAMQLERQSLDLVWSIECTEHLFDKPEFFRRAAGALRRGGRIAVCAWLASDCDSDENRRQVEAVCKKFLCPSLGTMTDYQRWMNSSGLTLNVCQDWTDRVTKTWEICLERVRRSKIRYLAGLSSETADFLDGFETILQAYRSGALRYGALVFELR
jgi:tocopherol O-methyltransferase